MIVYAAVCVCVASRGSRLTRHWLALSVSKSLVAALDATFLPKDTLVLLYLLPLILDSCSRLQRLSGPETHVSLPRLHTWSSITCLKERIKLQFAFKKRQQQNLT